MSKAVVSGVDAVVAELVVAVKKRVAELEKAAKAEGKKDYGLSKDQVRAILMQEWDNIANKRLIDAVLAEASAEVGL